MVDSDRLASLGQVYRVYEIFLQINLFFKKKPQKMTQIPNKTKNVNRKNLESYKPRTKMLLDLKILILMTSG